MPSFTSSFKVKYSFFSQRFADFSCIFNMKAYSECIKQHAFLVILSLTPVISTFLRTVPTKYEVFASNWDHAQKVDLCKSYWNPKRKIGVATHFSEISLESQQKC